jgi:hypothetical protein
MENLLEAHSASLSYLSDIASVASPSLTARLLPRLLARLIVPFYVAALMDAPRVEGKDALPPPPQGAVTMLSFGAGIASAMWLRDKVSSSGF